MARFGSREWIDGLSRAAAAVETDPSLSMTIEQRIAGPDATAWHLLFDNGAIQARPGPAGAPTVTLTASRDTAAAIHAGELSAQRAFLDGELQIGGDLNALIANRGALGEVAALLRRSAT